MKTSILLFLVLLVSYCYSQEPNIDIVWKSPATNNTTTSIKTYNLQACINTSEKINEVALYLNNTLVKNVIFNTEVTFRGQCDLFINENIELNNGANEIKIFARSDNYLIERKIIINYEFISAKYYALIIAVQDYDDSKITDLAEPLKDAEKLSKTLIDNYTFEKENVRILENPTNSEIIGALHNMRSYINENDNLLIFYAGHGYWDEEMGTGYWLPRDAQKDNPANWLPNTTLTSYLSAIKSKHTLLVADACFSGGIFKTRKAFNEDQVIERLYQMQSRKAITSGTLTEVPDKSVFIEYLIKRLNENKDKYVTSEQVFSNIRYAVLNNSSNVPQYGTIQNTGDEGGDFIFIRKKADEPKIIDETIVQDASITSEIINNEKYKKLLAENEAKEKAEQEAKLLKEEEARKNAELEAKQLKEEETKRNTNIEAKNDEQKEITTVSNETKEVLTNQFDILKSIETTGQQNIATIYKGKDTKIDKVKNGKNYYLFVPEAKNKKEQYIGKIQINNIDENKVSGNIILNNRSNDKGIDDNIILRSYLPKYKGSHHILRLNLVQLNPPAETEENDTLQLDAMSAFTGFEFINGYMFNQQFFVGLGTGFVEEYHQPYSDAKISCIPLFLNFRLGLKQLQFIKLNVSYGTNIVPKFANPTRPYEINRGAFYSSGIEFKRHIASYGAFTLGIDFEMKNFEFVNYSRYDSKALSFTKIKIGFEPNFSIF